MAPHHRSVRRGRYARRRWQGTLAADSRDRVGALSIKNVVIVSRPDETYSLTTFETPTAIVGALGGNALDGFRVEIDYPYGTTYLEQVHQPDASNMNSAGLVLDSDAANSLLSFRYQRPQMKSRVGTCCLETLFYRSKAKVKLLGRSLRLRRRFPEPSEKHVACRSGDAGWRLILR